ncbi:MAG: Signal transduction histidine kinase, partial [Jatrophihabitantaceae bacterium]|nr:Signal transduction histidine kinase [Jatrophihabitantaceae bacterium]
GRLAAAAADHRMGVAESIVARMESLGGSATVAPGPGGGTEVELRVPRGRVVS